MSHRRPLVCYMTQGYRVRGGHEAHLLHYATELRQHGFDTRILVLDALPPEEHLFIRLLRERGIPLESVRPAGGWALGLMLALLAPAWGAWMVARGRRPQWDVLRNHLADRMAARVLRRRLAELQPELIHVLGRLANYAWSTIPARRAIFHHGTEGRRDPTWDAAELQTFCAFVASAARNFAPGEGVATNLRREFGITRRIDPIFTLCPDAPGAVDLAARASLTPVAPPRRFGIVCRMTPEKGIDDILEALRVWHGQRTAVDFLFAGGGAMEVRVKAAIQEHRWPRVTQQASFESPLEVLSRMDIFVHPSRSDAMPMALAEALMAGRPCIVSRVGGIPDLIRHEQEGLLIDAGNPGQLVAAMARFADMPAAEFGAYCRRARARYEDLCLPSRVGATVAEHYRNILREPKETPA